MSILAVNDRYEEAHEEYDYDQEDESNGVFECSPESLPECLDSIIGVYLVVFLVPEICERTDYEAENRVEAIQGIVNNLQR